MKLIIKENPRGVTTAIAREAANKIIEFKDGDTVVIVSRYASLLAAWNKFEKLTKLKSKL